MKLEYITLDEEGEWNWDDDWEDDDLDDLEEGEELVDNDAGMTSDQARKLIEDFFGGIDTETANGGMTYCMSVSAEKRQILKGAPCHAGFSNINPMWIGSMFFTSSKNEVLADEFWDWMTDKKESPWARLVQDLEPLKDKNGNRVAWLMPGSILKKEPFNYVKNFAIACRGLTEHPEAIRMWSLLIRKGMEPADALVYASHFVSDEKGVISLSEHRSGGWHWPLTTSSLNINTLRKGQYSKNQLGGINIGWQPPRNTPIKEDDLPQEGKRIKTRFSEYDSIDIQAILDHHKKWIQRAEKVK